MENPSGGGEETHVLDIQGDWSLYTLTGDDIYYIAGTLPRQIAPHANIESFRPATGARKHIATIEKPLRADISVSPDGQFLFYTQLDRQISELMLIENFR